MDQPLEDLSDLLHMLLHGIRVDQDIIYLDNNKSVKHVFEYIVNECLKDGRTVDKPEWHNEIFIVTGGCGECSLPFVPLLDANEIVGAAEV